MDLIIPLAPGQLPRWMLHIDMSAGRRASLGITLKSRRACYTGGQGFSVGMGAFTWYAYLQAGDRTIWVKRC